MILLQKLTETEITHLFSGLVVTEGQYRFVGRAAPDQEQKVSNDIIDPENGAEMEYRNLMEDDQH